MVEIQTSQGLQALLLLLPIVFNNMLEEVLHLGYVIHKDGQQVFNSNFLPLLKLEFLVVFTYESTMLKVFQ